MIMGPGDPRAIKKSDPAVIARGSTLSDFDKFLDTPEGQAMIASLAETLEP